jgi:hypothetical protein
MITSILEASASDQRLSAILTGAREYAQVYVLARQRQKGCDGMGELATMKEEFRDVIDKVIQYCKDKKYISEVVPYDIDAIADEIVKGQDIL